MEGNLKWYLNGNLILQLPKKEEFVGNARPRVTPEGTVTGWEFLPNKNVNLNRVESRLLNLKEWVTMSIIKTRKLALGPQQIKNIVETVYN